MKACLIPLPSSAPSPRRPPLCRARSPSLPLLAFGLFSFLEGGLGSLFLCFGGFFSFLFFRFSCRVPFSCLSFVYFTFLFSSFVSFILASRISFVSFSFFSPFVSFIILYFRLSFVSLSSVSYSGRFLLLSLLVFVFLTSAFLSIFSFLRYFCSYSIFPFVF